MPNSDEDKRKNRERQARYRAKRNLILTDEEKAEFRAQEAAKRKARRRLQSENKK